MKRPPEIDVNLELLTKTLKKTFPEVSDAAIIKYLHTQQSEYFYLTPLEFSRLDDSCFRTVVQNIKNYKYGEIMGS